MTQQTCQPDSALFDVLISEPAEVYHAKSGEYLSSHQLADFCRSPLLYHRKRCGLIPDKDRPAYLVGRAAHTVILEGQDAFQQAFAVGGPVNPKTGLPYGSSTKAFAEWAAAHRKDVLTHDQYELVMRMAESVRQHEQAQELLSDGVAEAVVRAEYCGMPSQIRMDFLSPHLGLCDLKTVDNIDYFESDARRYRYCHQLAFYVAVLAERIGIRMPAFFIAVEKREPHLCGVWRVTEEVLDEARRENEAAIARLRRCQETDTWPTGYEDERFFDYL
jgi:hypothetical protein